MIYDENNPSLILYSKTNLRDGHSIPGQAVGDDW